MVFKSFISKNKSVDSIKENISLYLSLSNLLGIIGSAGILISGIVMVILNPGYGFFQMSANYWLATKQILMTALLVIIFVFIIPQARKLRILLKNNTAAESTKETYTLFNKIFKLNRIIHIIVIINFLLAITHRYIS